MRTRSVLLIAAFVLCAFAASAADLTIDYQVNVAAKDYARLVLDPSYYRPKEEPFKRYVYGKSGDRGGTVPYRTEWPGRRSWATRRVQAWESVRYVLLEKAMKTRRLVSRGRSDPVIDDCLIAMVSNRAFGFGL